MSKISILQLNNMQTELTEIQDQLHTYMYSNSQEEIDRAEVYLKKIHKKYGTVDVVQIKNIIK